MRPSFLRRRQVPLQGLCAVLAVGLSLGSTSTVWAQAPAGDESETSDDALAEAQRLYRLGAARYELFDYTAAIQYWTEAYSLVPEGDANAHRVRTVLVRNLSVAHLKAYDVDKDPVHLRTGKMLLERYIKELQTYYTEEGDTTKEVEEAQETLAEIEEKLAAVQAAEDAAADSGQTDGATDQGAETGSTGGGDDPTGSTDTGPSTDEEGLRKAKLLMTTGGVVMAVVGVGAGLGLGVGGALIGSRAEEDAVDVDVFDRPNTLDRGRLGNTLAYAGIGIGAAGLITGAVLLGIGAKKKKQALSGRVSFTPSLSPRNAGGSLKLEF